MKNIFFFLLLLGSMTTSAQATFRIFNFTSSTIRFELQTIGGTTRLRSHNTTPGQSTFDLTAGNSVTYTNAGGTFPFYTTPTVTPNITRWYRVTSPSSTWILTASATAQSTYGALQTFNYIKFDVISALHPWGGNLGLSPFGNYLMSSDSFYIAEWIGNDIYISE